VARITATEAARNFSAVLNRVAAGESVEVIRNGAPVAVIAPPAVRWISADRFRDLIVDAPAPDEGFAADVRSARRSVGPADASWPS
jgi:prevent-host-death family protein